MFNAVLSLVILVINTNNLGQVGLGTITLVVLGITVLLMISNFIGGGALVYLVPRHDLYKLFVPSYIWALITSVFGAIILQIFNLIPAEYTWYILVMSLFQSFAMINLTILIGKEKISLYNTLTVIQQVVTTLVLILLIYVWHRVEVIAYVYALFSGYVLVFLLSLAAIRKYVTVTSLSGVRYVIGELFKYGKFLQIANIIQFFNYRLSYYIIEAFSGRAALGLYGAGVQISEGVWLIGKSVATVQYARISNVNDMIYARNVTLRLLKFTFLLTAIVLAGLLALPERLYGAIFGQDFENIRLIMLTLALGILATAVSMLVSHFFSGTGKPQHNMIGSAIGLVFTLVLGLVFIPRYGLIAAGLTASVSYIMNMAYLLIVFIRRSGAEIKDFLISREDYLFVRSEVKKIMERNS
ncbi:MAG: polysaccharide biosynthesis C-terminal domain-containing protein [Bacteroidetes bacterium]|nr:polysaccharide biosynthesis C-terminal domain-containing protein [Bacteroidota bacterium]